MSIATGTSKQIEWAQSIVDDFRTKIQAGHEKIATRRRPERDREWMESCMEASLNAITAIDAMTDAPVVIDSRHDVNFLLKACGWERPERMKVSFALGEANGIAAFITHKSNA